MCIKNKYVIFVSSQGGPPAGRPPLPTPPAPLSDSFPLEKSSDSRASVIAAHLKTAPIPILDRRHTGSCTIDGDQCFISAATPRTACRPSALTHTRGPPAGRPPLPTPPAPLSDSSPPGKVIRQPRLRQAAHLKTAPIPILDRRHPANCTIDGDRRLISAATPRTACRPSALTTPPAPLSDSSPPGNVIRQPRLRQAAHLKTAPIPILDRRHPASCTIDGDRRLISAAKFADRLPAVRPDHTTGATVRFLPT